MRILLVTQRGLIADGLARSLAQIGKRAQVFVCDPAENTAGHPVPTLVVVDMDATVGLPANLVARFTERFPSTPIVAMGSMLDESLMTASIRAGAKAYLPKSYGEWQAVGVLRVVLQGSSGPDSAPKVIRKESAFDDNSRPRQRNPYGLTKAETEVLSLLCEGLTSFAIAKLRGGKEGTIKAHLNKIYPKLGVPNRLGALRIGQRLYEVQQCQLARAGDQASVRGWLLPHMQLEHKRKGELLFHKGDPARTLYFIQQGRIALPEIGVEMSDGELFGEIGIFTPAHTRSFTARCETDTKLFCLGADEAMRLFFEHPQFAYHVMQLMARRLQADSTRTGLTHGSKAT
jgi:DNA-binding NarL/FixJ family response regulator